MGPLLHMYIHSIICNQAMKKPKIIVVVPAHNEEENIKHFIEGLLAGKRRPEHIILVDNNSTDATVSTAKKFSEVIVIHEPRQGICYAVTAGYQKAYEMNADIICRSDADARPYDEWLYEIEEVLGRNPDVVAVTGSQTVYNASQLEQYYCVFLDWFIAQTSRLLMRGTIFLRGTNVAFRARIWPQCKTRLLCKEDLIHEDMDISLAMAKSGRLLCEQSLRMPVARRTFIKPAPQAVSYIRRWVRIASFAWRS